METPFSKPQIIGIVLLFVALGGFLRFYSLGSQSYWMDEGYTINAVDAIVQHGSPILDSGLPYNCPAYCYPTATIVKTFGSSPTTYRLLAAIVGTVFIGAIFLITKKLLGTRIALLSTFFVAFSYWQIAWSRQARWYTLYELFLWLTLYFAWQYFSEQRHKILNASLTAIFVILAVITHNIGLLLPLILLAWFAMDVIRRGKPYYIVGGIAAAVALAVGAEYLSDHHLIGPILQMVHFHYELPYWLSFYLRTYWMFIPFTIFAALDYSRPSGRVVRFLLFPFLVYLAAFSFFTDIIQYRYLFALTPVLYIGTAAGIFGLCDLLKNKMLRWGVLALTVIVFFVGGFGVWHPMTQYWLESDNTEQFSDRPYKAYTPQPDWNAAYAYVAAHRQVSDIIISSNPVFTKIFLHQPGDWIKYDYLGLIEDSNKIANDREYYVGARVIDDLVELKSITTSGHGWVILDSMALDGRISSDIQQYITSHFTESLHLTTNPWSQIWVYKF